jgi:hypothetical protein
VWLAGYLVTHFAFYVLASRRVSWFAGERGVFLFHALSNVLVTALALAGWATGALSSAVVAVCVLGHGMYSTTFLWIWSGTQGGYSAAILDAIWRSSAEGTQLDWSALEGVGKGKQGGRLADVEALGLVVCHDGRFVLTSRGRAASVVAELFAALANVQLRE